MCLYVVSTLILLFFTQSSLIFIILIFLHSFLSPMWGISLLCSVMFVVLLFFVIYHCYLVTINCTTNERTKLGWLKDGININSHHQLSQLSPIYLKKREEFVKISQKLADFQKKLEEAKNKKVENANEHINTNSSTDIDNTDTKEASSFSTSSSSPSSSSDSHPTQSTAPYEFFKQNYPPPTSDGINLTDESNPVSPSDLTDSTSLSTVSPSIFNDSSNGSASLSTSNIDHSPSIPSKISLPPPPHSPDLKALLDQFRLLKTETQSLYQQVQTLQKYGYIENRTEGCTPSLSPIPSLSTVKKPNTKAIKNPYSKGFFRNWWEILNPTSVASTSNSESISNPPSNSPSKHSLSNSKSRSKKKHA
jgi:hypothetical protein